MTNQQYIHINEAVKKREKTRQTFYNYIHKGLVRTKKINNKVYLYQDDVEQLMNGFIPSSVTPTQVENTSEAQEATVPEVKETVSIFPKEIAKIQADMTRLHKQYYSLKDDLLKEIKRTRQELILDTKNITYTQEQHIMQSIDQHSKELRNRKTGLLDKMKKLQFQHKKQSFWLGYCAFVIANFLIITYMI